MNEAILAQELTTILADLIAIPSAFPENDTVAISAYAAARLKAAGYSTDIVTRTKGVDNVVARLGRGKPSLVFNAHADTVGVGERANWQTDPFQPVVKDGQVIGLGAGNCKGSMAVQLWLAEAIARRGGPRQGEVVFTFVGDEENLGPDGMSLLRSDGHIKPDMLVLGAQTQNQLIAAERGVFWARITTFGKAAHAGDPDNGVNAISAMVRVINEFESKLKPVLKARIDGPMCSTISIGKILGGHNTNVVPALCTMDVDRRLLPAEKLDVAFKELGDVARAAAGERNVTVELTTGTNGFRSLTDGPLVQAFAAEIEARLHAPPQFLNAVGVSDGRYFADDGISILNFGPGSAVQGHSANESIAIAQMVDAAVIQLGVSERLLGLARP